MASGQRKILLPGDDGCECVAQSQTSRSLCCDLVFLACNLAFCQDCICSAAGPLASDFVRGNNALHGHRGPHANIPAPSLVCGGERFVAEQQLSQKSG